LHGPTPGPFSIMVENLEPEEELVHFKKYSYQPYTDGPMCGIEQPASGCFAYDQTLARSAVVEFCANVVDQFPTPFEAWTFALKVVGGEASTIPYYAWKKIWTMFSARPDYTWKAYKFITHGGLESNTKAVTEKDLNFCYRIAEVDTFAQGCCAYMKKNYKNVHEAYRSLVSERSGQALFQTCASAGSDSSKVPSRPQDYLDLYLDADGYQGLLPHDLDYCWVGSQLSAPLGTRAPLQTGRVHLETPVAPVAPVIAVGPTVTVAPLPADAALAQAGPSVGQEFPTSSAAAARGLSREASALPSHASASPIASVASPTFRLGATAKALPSPVQSLGLAAIGLSVCGAVSAGVLLGAFLCGRSQSKLRREAQLASPYGPHVQLATSPDGPMHYLIPEE